MTDVALTVNGVKRSAPVDARVTLADFLRDDLGLTGTHLACEHGVCGACTVLVDGDSVRSCLLLAVQADGADVTTIEGEAAELETLRAAFKELLSFQCGFCTPGFVMTAVELLRQNPHPSDEEIREAISGNLCRCTGYESIVRGIALAAERRT